MNLALIASNDNLTSNLQYLMYTKKITEAELARKTHIPQPTLHKILSGKTNDPRASTLKALADYFEISIDELLTGISTTRINTASKSTQSVAIISWSDCLDATTFTSNLTPTNWHNWIVTEFISENIYALVSKPSMTPTFPKGTVFIIDPILTPEDGDYIVVQYPNTQEATIRQLSIDGPTKLLLPLNLNTAQSVLEPAIKILGILVKSVFSYHTT